MRRCTTCGGRPRSACRRSAAHAARVCTCARTRSCWNASTRPAHPSARTSRPPERLPPASPTAPSRSSAMTLAIKSIGCPASARAEACSRGWPTSAADVTMTSATAPPRSRRACSATSSARIPASPSTRCIRPSAAPMCSPWGCPTGTALASALAAALRRHGLSDPEVEIRVVDRLQRHESTGKLKRFVPLG